MIYPCTSLFIFKSMCPLNLPFPLAAISLPHMRLQIPQTTMVVRWSKSSLSFIFLVQEAVQLEYTSQ